MAVGNEAKLILKLAREHMEVERLAYGKHHENNRDRVDGYEDALILYQNKLRDIVSELEEVVKMEVVKTVIVKVTK